MKKAHTVIGSTLCIYIILFLNFNTFAGGAKLPPSISIGNRTFALELYKKIAQSKGNVVISPISLSTVFAMTYFGARGETKLQMEKTLHFNSEKGFHDNFKTMQSYYNSLGSNTVTIANALWGQKGYPFLKTFTQDTSRYYDGAFFTVDFAKKPKEARSAVNNWVKQKTQKKISEIIGKGVIDSSTSLILCNAVHFKDFWKIRFDKSQTKPGDFYSNSKKKITAQFMKASASFKHKTFNNFKAIQLPYKREALSMIIFLPDAKDGLNQLEKRLTIDLFDNTIDQLTAQPSEKIQVALPKFKASKDFELSKLLSDMGMYRAFAAADFSGMTGKKDLFIGQVLHKAIIEVSEKGTEAAGASAVVMYRSAAPPKTFTADHPFIYFIYDNKMKNILFMGRLITP